MRELSFIPMVRWAVACGMNYCIDIEYVKRQSLRLACMALLFGNPLDFFPSRVFQTLSSVARLFVNPIDIGRKLKEEIDLTPHGSKRLWLADKAVPLGIVSIGRASSRHQRKVPEGNRAPFVP